VAVIFADVTRNTEFEKLSPTSSQNHKMTTMTAIGRLRGAYRHLYATNSHYGRVFTTKKLFLRSLSSWSSLSTRDFAALEARLVHKVGSTVKDPILNTDLKTLGWIQRRIKVTDKDNSLELQLKLPTLLHAQRQELTSAVESALREELTAIAGEKGIDQKSVNVNVEITAAPTVPVVARRPEEHDEVIRNLGPGLAKVAHFLAVYSCKVQNRSK
jgi:hypothetical protein